LFQVDTIVNVKNLFEADVVYAYLGLPENRKKYDITVENDRDIIVLNDTTAR